MFANVGLNKIYLTYSLYNLRCIFFFMFVNKYGISKHPFYYRDCFFIGRSVNIWNYLCVCILFIYFIDNLEFI